MNEDKRIKKLIALEKRAKKIKDTLDMIESKWQDEKEKLQKENVDLDLNYEFSDVMA